MSKYIVKDFNYIASGEKTKIINLDIESVDKTEKYPNMTYICGIEENDTIMDFEQNYNKSSLYDTNTKQIIHNLYDIKDVCLKSDIKQSLNDNNVIDSYKSDNYVDIYGPQLTENPIDFVQFGKYVYCLSKLTNEGPFFKETTMEEDHEMASDFIDTTYTYNIENDKLKTYLYSSNNNPIRSENFEINRNLENIEYNYLFEIPLDHEVNDFESGDIHADIFQTKNVYNSYYSMDMNNQTTLNNCREYCGIGNGCGKIFLKYYDNKKYSGSTTKNDGDITTISMNKQTQPYSFQKVETLETIDRFVSNTKHKSNLYSIEIKDTGLNNNDEKSEKIKQDIKNNVREIVKKITPANTQLFDIFFSGE